MLLNRSLQLLLQHMPHVLEILLRPRLVPCLLFVLEILLLPRLVPCLLLQHVLLLDVLLLHVSLCPFRFSTLHPRLRLLGMPFRPCPTLRP